MAKNLIKYVVVIGDGMADRPIKELGEDTPLKKANKPNIDRLTSYGIAGKIKTIPDGFHPGSDIANMNILGYNPKKYYSGRAPLEAISIGIDLKRNDVAYRCNLVTIKYNREKTRAIMEDYSGGHISTEEAKELIKAINENLSTKTINFYSGVSYRHIMVWSKGAINVECTPPHDITGKEISDYLPVGEGENILRELMLKSTGILECHPINRERIRIGKKPANAIWLWGQGKKTTVPTFKEKYGIDGALISAVDLMKGLGKVAGFEVLDVPGITGYLDTNYLNKAKYALKALEEFDIVYIHIEAPDEAGHAGSYKNKIKAIEDIDKKVIGTLLRGLKKFPHYRILILPDHATPVSVKTHTGEPVPFVIFDNCLKMKNKKLKFDESITQMDNVLCFDNGYQLMDFFISPEKIDNIFSKN